MKKIFIILNLLAIAIVSLLYFSIFSITYNFILSYNFLIISALMQLIPVFMSERVNDTVCKIAMYSISAIYFVVQFIASFLCCMILDLPLMFIIAISLILLLTDIAVVFIIEEVGISIDKSNIDEKYKVSSINNIIYKFENIKSKSSDKDVVDLLNNIIEQARYSDLNNMDKIIKIESEILQQAENVEKFVLSSKIRETKDSCKKIISLFSEREMLCKLYK